MFRRIGRQFMHNEREALRHARGQINLRALKGYPVTESREDNLDDVLQQGPLVFAFRQKILRLCQGMQTGDERFIPSAPILQTARGNGKYNRQEILCAVLEFPRQ